MRKGLGILAVMACGVVASSTGCKFGTDHKAAVEKTVGELFEQLFEVKPGKVVCPGEDKKIPDGDHVCTVTTVDGVDVEVNVNVKGSKVFVKGKTPLLVVKKFIPEMSKKLPEGSGEVTCAGPAHLIAKTGTVLECSTDKLDVRVEFKDDEGNYRVTWGDKGSGGGAGPAGGAPGLPTGDAPFAQPGGEPGDQPGDQPGADEAGGDEPADD